MLKCNDSVAEFVDTETLSDRYILVETETWRLTFASLGFQFDTESFLREAKDSLDHALRSALFHGGQLDMEMVRSLPITEIRARSSIITRSAMLNRITVKEKQSHLRPVT